MQKWRYEIRDITTRKLLMAAGNFDTKDDAAEQARMEISLHNIKGCCIHVSAGAAEEKEEK